MAGIFISGNRRGAWVFFHIIFRLFPQCVPEKIQYRMKAPESESAPNGLLAAGIVRADIESDVIFNPWIDQIIYLCPFFAAEDVGVVVGNENGTR